MPAGFLVHDVSKEGAWTLERVMAEMQRSVFCLAPTGAGCDFAQFYRTILDLIFLSLVKYSCIALYC